MNWRNVRIRGSSLAALWQLLPSPIKLGVGVAGSLLTLWVFWHIVLIPLRWPELSLVCRYFLDSLVATDSYKSLLMTGLRAILATVIGFALAVLCGLLTGRTVIGWVLLFILLLIIQKVPAIAMVHVFVRSRLSIGTQMTIALASTVVFTFTWVVVHHRARSLDEREVFGLRVIGMSGWRLALYGLLPHLGAALGGAARLASAIAVVIVVIGEWQGLWADDSLWQYGLGVLISRSYDLTDSEARVLAYCLWLGILGVILDGIVLGILRAARRITGVAFIR